MKDGDHFDLAVRQAVGERDFPPQQGMGTAGQNRARFTFHGRRDVRISDVHQDVQACAYLRIIEYGDADRCSGAVPSAGNHRREQRRHSVRRRCNV